MTGLFTPAERKSQQLFGENMMKKWIYILAFTIVYLLFAVEIYSAGKSVSVKEISFYGLHHFNRKQALNSLDLKPGQKLDPEKLHQKCQALLDAYAVENILFTRIDSVTYQITADSSAMSLAFYIHEGKPAKTGTINLNGPLHEYVRSHLFYNEKSTFDPYRFQDDLDASVTALEEQGHPFAQINLNAIRLDTTDNGEHRIDFDFDISPGPELTIEEIQVVGNEVTKDYVIKRETRVKKGERYNARKIKSIPSRLRKLDLFESVSEPEIFIASQNKGGILIQVKEGNTSTFDGVVGYSPATEYEKGYFTGLVDINIGNLFGTGRSLLVHWQKRDQYSQDLKLRYREPWIGGIPLNAGVGFEQIIQDTTYIERNTSLDLSYPIMHNLSLVGEIKNNSIMPDSIGSYAFGIPQSKTLRTSFGIEYDSRDNTYNPSHGIYYYTSFESGRKKNIGPADIIQMNNLKKNVKNNRIALDVKVYIPIFQRQIFSTSFHGRQIKSNEDYIPVPDLYRLGGTRSLRGYREDQFRGSSIAWSNLEYRYLLGRRSRAFVFCDLGYISTSGKEETRDIKIGYGFGVRLETGLGIMGIDYGLAFGEKQGLFGGMIHVGLVNEF